MGKTYSFPPNFDLLSPMPEAKMTWDVGPTYKINWDVVNANLAAQRQTGPRVIDVDADVTVLWPEKPIAAIEDRR